MQTYIVTLQINYVYRYSVYIHIHMFIDAFAKVSYRYICRTTTIHIHISEKNLLQVSFVWLYKETVTVLNMFFC